MLRVQEKIAHSLKLGGKLIFISGDEVNTNCPLIREPKKWAALPFFIAKSLNKELLKNLSSEKDWLCCSENELLNVLELCPFFPAARLVVKSKVDAKGKDSFEKKLVSEKDKIEDFQIDVSLEESDFQSDFFWEEIQSLFYSHEIVPDVKEAYQKPCLFLDRDDVVIKDVPYATEAGKVELISGISELINQAHYKNYWVALVTNQSGLGRGWIDWNQYQAVHQKMLKLLADKKAYIDDYQFSSYIGESDLAYGSLLPSLRKPRAGMFHRVQEKLKVDINNSIMVGDSATDLIAAFSFGLRRLYLLKSHKVDKQIVTLKSYCETHNDFSYQVIENLLDVSL